MSDCTHADTIAFLETEKDGCEDCLKTGDTWVNLRMCTTCGKVGCCDSSKNKHATAHFKETEHPVMRSVMPGETWLWCFVDEVGLEIEG